MTDADREAVDEAQRSDMFDVFVKSLSGADRVVVETYLAPAHSVNALGEMDAHYLYAPELRAAIADRIEELEAKLAKAVSALEGVQDFVRDLEPYADQGHTLVPALQKACETQRIKRKRR
jgi:hypothetical protein